MPRLPKPRPLRQNTERSDIGLVPVALLPPEPIPTPGWLPVTKGEWHRLWTSPLAATMIPETDEPLVRRLFGLRDERERMMRVVRKSRIVGGSRGQPRANPLYSQISGLDAEIRQLEDRVGLSPRSRLQLGIQLGDAWKSLADLNAAFDDDTDSAAQADVLLAFGDSPPTVDGPTRRVVDGGQSRPRTG